MTKENRERTYKHLRDLENNYEPKDPSLNKGPTATSTVRKRAKESADAILLKHPELEKPIVKNTNDEVMKEPVKETKSKVKK